MIPSDTNIKMILRFALLECHSKDTQNVTLLGGTIKIQSFLLLALSRLFQKSSIIQQEPLIKRTVIVLGWKPTIFFEWVSTRLKDLQIP